jgi:phage gpG-like protein
LNATATLNLTEMNRLGDELRRLGAARVRVGILGGGLRQLDPSGAKHPATGIRRRLGSVSRYDEAGKPTNDINNAELGLIHEFGTKNTGGQANIPARSFLRVPLMTRLQNKIDEIGRGVWRAIVLQRGLLPALATLGTVARNLVDEAFASRGFGQWAPNTAATIRRKGSSSPLIDSAQLRKSITYQVARSSKS